jgi:hypothetical protein
MKMKKNYTIAGLAILLAASLGVNVWLHHDVRRYEGRQPFLPFLQLDEIRVQYPIPGLSDRDLRDILSTFKALPPEEQGGGILQIMTYGGNNVVVQTGTIQGPLSGRGRFHVFTRSNDGWIHNKRLSTTSWIS